MNLMPIVAFLFGLSALAVVILIGYAFSSMIEDDPLN